MGLNNFDLIRLLAALQVAIVHAGTHLGVPGMYLDVLRPFPGVPVFFLISGFLIFQSYANARSPRIYAINRLLRIYPALVACFFVSVMLVVSTGYLGGGDLISRRFWIWAAAQLSFVQFYNPDFMRGFGVGVLNGSLWTISVELQFYILIPFLFHFVSRWPRMWPYLIAAFVIPNVFLANFVEGESFISKLFGVSFLPWFYMFLVGAWLAARTDILDRMLRLPLAFYLGLYALAAISTYLAGLPLGSNDINPLMYIALAALIIRLAFCKPNLSERLLGRNDISYGIYIYHMPIINLMIFHEIAGTPLAILLALGSTAAAACLSWIVVEKPALMLKKRTLRRVGPDAGKHAPV